MPWGYQSRSSIFLQVIRVATGRSPLIADHLFALDVGHGCRDDDRRGRHSRDNIGSEPTMPIAGEPARHGDVFFAGLVSFISSCLFILSTRHRHPDRLPPLAYSSSLGTHTIFFRAIPHAFFWFPPYCLVCTTLLGRFRI